MHMTRVLAVALLVAASGAEAGSLWITDPLPAGKVVARRKADLRVYDDDVVVVETKQRGWGRLDIEVEPDRARVYLDGKYIGRGDERREVRAGRHHIRVRTSSYGEVSRTVFVRAGYTTRVRLFLD